MAAKEKQNVAIVVGAFMATANPFYGLNLNQNLFLQKCLFSKNNKWLISYQLYVEILW